MVANGGHPDLHVLGPDGAGAQIGIGGRDAKVRGVRDLTDDLSLMPMEGGARIALIESAHRMNEDAQGALLKTLEEPPAGVTIILCADDEDRLLPTIRSRCARLRLGRVGARDVEAILADHGLTDAPLAGRLARLSGGRPGVAMAYARSPEAVRLRGELARRLLDLSAASSSARLAAIRSAGPTALDLVDALDAAAAMSVGAESSPRPVVGRARGRAATAKAATATTSTADPAGDDPDDAGDDGPTRAIPAARRRRAAEALIAVWLDVTRDVALVGAEGTASVRDPDLLEESRAAAAALDPAGPARFLATLERGAELVAGNVSPELVLDSLVLAWPERRAA
jgi:DNA polymerase-3 subunit delta'